MNDIDAGLKQQVWLPEAWGGANRDLEIAAFLSAPLIGLASRHTSCSVQINVRPLIWQMWAIDITFKWPSVFPRWGTHPRSIISCPFYWFMSSLACADSHLLISLMISEGSYSMASDIRLSPSLPERGSKCSFPVCIVLGQCLADGEFRFEVTATLPKVVTRKKVLLPMRFKDPTLILAIWCGL